MIRDGGPRTERRAPRSCRRPSSVLGGAVAPARTASRAGQWSATGGPVPARRLTENEDRIGPLRSHQPIHHFDRYRAQRRKGRDGFVVLGLLREVDEDGRVELAILV